MRTVRQVSIMAFLAICPSVVLAGGATASRSISIEGSRTINATGVLTFESEFAELTCDVTLRGEITRSTVAKGSAGRPEGVVGQITEGRVARCRELFELGGQGSGELVNTAENPVSLRYEGFLGTLPSITGVRVTLLNKILRLRRGTIVCWYEGSLDRALFSETGGRQSFNRVTLEGGVLTLIEGDPTRCPATHIGRGVPALASAIRVRLL